MEGRLGVRILQESITAFVVKLGGISSHLNKVESSLSRTISVNLVFFFKSNKFIELKLTVTKYNTQPVTMATHITTIKYIQ